MEKKNKPFFRKKTWKLQVGLEVSPFPSTDGSEPCVKTIGNDPTSTTDAPTAIKATLGHLKMAW